MQSFLRGTPTIIQAFINYIGLSSNISATYYAACRAFACTPISTSLGLAVLAKKYGQVTLLVARWVRDGWIDPRFDAVKQ